MRTTNLKLPGLPGLNVYVHAARKGCEHFCFAGAALDSACYAIRIEVYAIVLIGKLAFAAGALGIYFLHLEEAAYERGQRNEETVHEPV